MIYDICKNLRCLIVAGIEMESVCQDHEVNIGCLDGRVIHVVSAMFGRQDWVTCPHPSILETNCSRANSLLTVTELCEGNQYCQFIANKPLFGGDPCQDTYKYIDITYDCIIIQGRFMCIYRCVCMCVYVFLCLCLCL